MEESVTFISGKEKFRTEGRESDPYTCWIVYAPGIGSGILNRMRAKFSELTGEIPGNFAEAVYRMPDAERKVFLDHVFAPGESALSERTDRILRSHRRLEPGRFPEDMQRRGIRMSTVDDPEFPEKLKGIPGAPFALFYRGRLPEREKCAAVVGARMCSLYGRTQAAEFGRCLGQEKIAVVSGMARGVDSIAQRAALEAGGPSFAVLGCGADVCYPAENRELYEMLIHQGGVISEYLPGTPARSQLFPARNRIISGLSDLLLLVEAKERSGSLITADYALEQGRDVYCVPGRISDALSRGTNRLIRQGAGIATCPEDVIEALTGVRRGTEDDLPEGEARLSLQEPEATIMDILRERNLCTAEILAEEAGKRLGRIIPVSEMVSWILQLELKDLIGEKGAGFYEPASRRR